MMYTVAQHGFTIVPEVINTNKQQALLAALGTMTKAGRRGILALSAVAELAKSTRLLEIIRPHFSSAPFPVRAIYFNKSAATNWLVPRHQDLTLAFQSASGLDA